MHLNSLLFPSPKSSYTLSTLKEELIWIPKYQTRISFSRLQTVGVETKKHPQFNTSPLESPRSMVPQLKCKTKVSCFPQTSLKVNISPKNPTKFNPQKAFINDGQCQNHPSKIPKPADLSDFSIQEISSIYEEKGETHRINLNEDHLKFITKPSKTRNKSREVSPSYNMSADETTKPVKTQENMEKKFILTGTNNLTAKICKARLPTRDSSRITETESISHLRPRIPFLKKQSNPKISQTFDVGVDIDCDYDEGVINEHSDKINSLSTPGSLYKYETKMLTNPHSLNTEYPCDRNFFTEFADSTPDKIARFFTPTPQQKARSRMSLIVSPRDTIEYQIPCLFLKSKTPNNKILLYFHGNGEDINLARELLNHVREKLNINIIAVEYPGYGLYQGVPSEERVQMDAEVVFDYLTTNVANHSKNIIVFGRSIGSGPATWLATRRNIGALVLMSAFTSIRSVVQHLLGKWAQYLIKERFNNLEHMSRVTCPTFIVHGQKDKLIPYQHSQELYNKCKGLCELVLPKEMNHIEFDFHEDFTLHLMEFLTQINFETDLSRNSKIKFPAELFQAPKDIS